MDSNCKISIGSLQRRVFFRILLVLSAISILSLLHSLPTMDLGSLTPKTYEYHDCVDEALSHNNVTLTPASFLFQSRILNNFWGSFDSMNCKKEVNLVSTVVEELMGHQRFLHYDAETLCIGEGSEIALTTMEKLGFTNVVNHRFYNFNKKKIVYSLDKFRDFSFDFVFTRDFNKVSVPALLVLEVERILKPGGIAAFVLVSDSDDIYSISSINKNNGLIRSASPISSLLRFSTIVHVGYVNNNNGLVVFKKNSESESESENTTSSLFYHEGLSEDCASVNFTKPFMNLIEPLVEETSNFENEKKISYLPKFVDVTSKKNLVYVNIGEVKNTWFPPSYPIDQKHFNVYFVHYDTSIMLSHVKGPRVTFVYHPELAEDFKHEDIEHYMGEEDFDLVAWFKETVENADFVVLKMNIAGKVEMKFLRDIYESGVICFIDELFLGCSESGGAESERGRCMDIYKGLRSNGVFVHQWWNIDQGSH
ncbi:uncharacterized protein [Cicer arietinum]|uniref:Uncharacterized protein LOC101500848 n=1 Tax=Cicer arietinum TaxID=3827 RepID=A0A1S2Y2M0_CICAR|nr:uncharacterized protein LOC101500848 [Cicer arietinum]